MRAVLSPRMRTDELHAKGQELEIAIVAARILKSPNGHLTSLTTILSYTASLSFQNGLTAAARLNHFKMEQGGEKVFLYIYDLSQGMARQLSATVLGNTIEGIWHSGIGLYGKEYFYGAGIQSCGIGQSPFGSPVEVLELGETHIPREIFEEFLQEIGPRYTMATYNLLNHNCNNFTDEAAQFLVGVGIPHHILRQADVALHNPLGALMSRAVPMLQQLETTLRHGGVPVPPALNSTRAAASMAAPMAASAAPVRPLVPAPPPRDRRRAEKENGMDIDPIEEK